MLDKLPFEILEIIINEVINEISLVAYTHPSRLAEPNYSRWQFSQLFKVHNTFKASIYSLAACNKKVRAVVYSIGRIPYFISSTEESLEDPKVRLVFTSKLYAHHAKCWLVQGLDYLLLFTH